MTEADTTPPAVVAEDGRRHRRRVLATLCVTEITSWGVLYYAFPVLAGSISAGTGWSLTALTLAFSAGQLATALVGIPVGRWLDRHGPRWIMTCGSLLAVPSLVVIAAAHSYPVFLVGWLLAGVAMGGVLYPPASAALTRWYGTRRIKALTVLTLVAGLASTVFAPLTAALNDHLGWRHTYLALAVVLAAVTIPAHVWGLRGPWPEPDDAIPGGQAPDRIARSRPFLALTAALTLTALAGYAGVINQVPLLVARGADTSTAVWALGLGGVGQVTARLGYPALARRLGVRARTLLILLAVAATTVLFGLLTSVPVLLGAAVVAGMARGVFTLLQSTAITERWGAAHYGRLYGLLSAPLILTVALAPWVGSALADALGGYPTMFIVLGVLAAAAATLALASSPQNSPGRNP